MKQESYFKMSLCYCCEYYVEEESIENTRLIPCCCVYNHDFNEILESCKNTCEDFIQKEED